MTLPTKFGLNLISSVSVNRWKLPNISKTRKWQEFRGAWPKVSHATEIFWPTRGQLMAWIQREQELIWPGMGNEFAHQILTQYNQWFVWKFMVTAQTRRGHRNGWNSVEHNEMVIKLVEALNSLFTKLGLTLVGIFSWRCRKWLDQSETGKQQKSMVSWPKVYHIWQIQ